ncbi:hypothetical protein CRV01_06605 [Arcobacter sp. CECT 8983]|uniref:HAMP domain-containing histidine kinase n=1 Tax=Arcobacter sp. CECT 8983 TaxID=2044508 RepID=UPI00100A8396|nr:HAMP domain-containing histidine kinase [Arcobacter sp. CECT 8983]RXJ90814.1 hypothetical protein CRV01_06605 [Arcobacter sp. CECT 8983]
MNKNDLFTEKNYRILQLADEITHVINDWKSKLNKIYTMSSGTLVNSEVGLATDDMYNETLVSVNENIKSIINTINSFETFLCNGKEIKQFNINNTLQNIISSHTSTYKKHDITIETNYSTTNYIYGYENELSQIFLYILSSLTNILKNKTESKFLIINTQRNKNKTIISIKSTNITIDEIPFDISLEISKKIIEEYYKGEMKIANKKFKFKGKSVYGIEFCIHLNNIKELKKG